MTGSLQLVRAANELLDSIDEKGERRPERLEELSELRAQMLLAGFNAPFSALMAASRDEMDEASADDMADVRKHMREVRYIASLKRFTLNRVRVASAAHRLADALADSGRSALIPLLPLGGSYRQALLEGGETAVEAYRKLMALFDQRSFSVRSASAVVNVVQDGEEVERTVDLEAGGDAKKTVARIFGEGATIRQVVLKKKASGLIKNHSTRVALFTLAARLGAREARAWTETQISGDDALARYNAILRKNGLTPNAVLTDSERFEKVKAEAHKAGFLTRNKAGDWVMDEEFEARLHRLRAQARRMAMERADLEVYRLLQWYYACFHAEGRKAYASMPAVLAEPSEAQLAVLNDLKPGHYPLSHPPRVLRAKMEFEAQAPPLPPREWGAAFVCLRAGLEPKWAEDELGVEAAKVASAMPLVKSLSEKPEGRAGAFVAELKKGKKKE